MCVEEKGKMQHKEKKAKAHTTTKKQLKRVKHYRKEGINDRESSVRKRQLAHQKDAYRQTQNNKHTHTYIHMILF